MAGIYKRALLQGLATGAAYGIVGATFGTAQAQTQEKPKYGGHLRTSYALEPTTLDSHIAKSGGDYYYLRAMHDNLIFLDRHGNPDPSRSLAEHWDISTSPDAMTFHLRRGINFHDGTPFNADAVKFNIERILDPKTGATSAALLKPIKSVDVIDEFTVRLNLDGPWAPGVRELSGATLGMVSPTAVKAGGKDYGWKPVGTGAFKLVEAVPGSFVHMARNEKYWLKDAAGNQLPYLNEVTFKVIKDDAVLAAALRSGELDLIYAPPLEVAAFRKDERFQIETFEGSGVATIILFNTALKPADNENLRRAIGYAVNPADINKAVFFDTNTVAKGAMWPPSSWVYEESKTRPNYNLAKANEALAACGMPDGFDINVVTWNGSGHPQASQVFQAQLARVGIRAHIQVLTVGTANDMFFQGNTQQIYFTSWSIFPEPDREVNWMMKTGGFYNASKKSTPEIDALIAQGAATYDTDKRRAIYQQLADLQVGQCTTLPFLYRNTYATAAKKVRNLPSIFDAEAIMNMKDLWMEG